MASYKNIRIKKKGGGTRIQRVQVLASGKYKFVKNTGTKSRTKASSKPKTKRRIFSMARRKKRRSRGSVKLPIGVLAGLGVGMAEPIGKALQGRWKEVGDDLSYRYIGYNANSKQFDINGLKQGLLPLIIGALVSRYVGGRSGLNLNQYLRGVPLIKI
jgi:hypothetical protein